MSGQNSLRTLALAVIIIWVEKFLADLSRPRSEAVVAVRQSGFRGIAANLGDVEFVGAPVVPGDKATAEGVAGALEEAARV